MSSRPRVFLSYSRKDVEIAAQLREKLEAEELSLWQDTERMASGKWWEQISKTLKAKTTEHMVLLVSHDALQSDIVKKEWRLARQEAVQVHPVQVPGKLVEKDFKAMPGWMSAEHFINSEKAGEFDRLVACLKGSNVQTRVPMMAPDPDPDFVLRPEEANELLDYLLDGENAAVGITAAIKGAGGFGKTELAKWLCHQPQVQDAFHDGILWVEMGETPNINILLDEVVQVIDGKSSGLVSEHAQVARLQELVADKKFLLVIDDAWEEHHLRPFLEGAEGMVRMVTTRIDSILPSSAKKVPVDKMKEAEASQLLAIGLDHNLDTTEIEANMQGLNALAEKLGEWALLLRLANRLLRDETDPQGGGCNLTKALDTVTGIYEEVGLQAFDTGEMQSRNSAAALSISVSLNRLSEKEVGRYEELALYPEDEHIPIHTILRLWGVKEGLGKHLLGKMNKYALFARYDRTTDLIRLHDVMRTFLQERVRAERLKKQHQNFITVYEGTNPIELEEAEQSYFYSRYPMHLHEAGETQKLENLLLDVGWMGEKLDVLGTPLPLIEDYREYASLTGTATYLIRRALELLTAPLLRGLEPRAPQFLGRFMTQKLEGREEKQKLKLVQSTLRDELELPVLLANWPTLTQAGGSELSRLEGHSDSVYSIACSSDDTRIVSGAWDNTVRVWDARTGSELFRLEGHSHSVNSVAFSSDGTRIVSGGTDKTVRVWDARVGKELSRLEGHSDRVTSVAYSFDDTRIVSGAWDNTVRVWDARTGKELSRLEGHSDGVTSVAFSSDDTWIVSGAFDKTVRVWDARTGKELSRLEDHSGRVSSVAFSSDDTRIVSGTWDNTVHVWDARTGSELSRLEGHSDLVSSVAFSSDDTRIVSGAFDNTVRVWDNRTGKELSCQEGHSDWVTSVAFSSDDTRIVSSAADNTVRVWDACAGSELSRLESHSSWVCSVNFSSDDTRIVSGAWDNTVRVWDARTGKELSRLEGHSDWVYSVAFSSDDTRIVSGGTDKTVRVWDARTGSELSRLEGHSDRVTSVAYSFDDTRIVSGAWDNTVRVWDARTGKEFFRLECHSDWVTSVVFSSDDTRIVSGAADNTVRVWDACAESELFRLEGHSDSVYAVAFSSDDTRIVSGGTDKTVRVWDARTGKELFRLEGHTGTVSSVAFSSDDTRIVSGATDKRVCVWDAYTGKILTTLELDAPIMSVDFSSNGINIVAGDGGGAVHMLSFLQTEKEKQDWINIWGMREWDLSGGKK